MLDRITQLQQENDRLQVELTQLRESEKRYRTLFELSSEGIARWGYKQPIPIALSTDEQLDLCYQSIYMAEVNDAFARMYEYEKAEDLIGLTLHDFHDRHSEVTQAAMQDWIENQYTCRSVETVEIDRHGRKRYFLNSASSTIENRCVVCTWVSQVDITQLREAQQALLEAEQARVAELAKANEELRQRDRLLSAVAQVTKNLLEAEDVDTAIPSALQVVGQAANISRVQLLLERQAPAKQKLQHIVAYEWNGLGIAPQIDHPTAAVLDNDEFNFMIQELHSGRSIWRLVEDFPDPIQTTFKSIGIESSGTVPIFIEGRYIGGIGFDDCITARQWSQQEIDVLTTAAESIGAALHRKQLVERLIEKRAKAAEERAAELAKVNDALKRAVGKLSEQPELDAFLGHVLIEAAEQVGACSNALFLYDEASHTLRMKTIYLHGQIADVATAPCLEIFRQPVPADISPAWKSIQSGWVITHETNGTDPNSHPQCPEWHREMGHETVVAVPLVVSGKTIGFMAPCFREWIEPSLEKIEFIQSLAHQATLALELTRLAEEAKQTALAKLNEVIAKEQEKAATQRAAQLAKANEALKRSLTMLALEPSLDKLLGYVLQAISDSLGDRSGAVYLFDDSNDTTTLHLNYENGQLQQGEQIDHPAATLRRPPQEWDRLYLPLLRQNQVLIHHESEFASPAYAPYRQHNAQRGIETLLFVPLLFGEQLLGSITLRSTQHRDYTPEELELARALAHQATLAIQLTRLAARECDRAILEERNRMARDIHDSLAQAFTGIILQLEAAKRKIAANQPQAAQNCLSRARSLAAAGLAEARRSVRALRPEVLESDDLPSALRYIVEQMSWNTDVEITLQIDGTPRPIPVDVEVNLLRIGQEAMTNALRHANAQNIRLNLLFEPQAVHLQIRDDGQGFEPQVQLTNGGFGLIGMQERSRQIGGELRLVSSIGRGTEAIVTVPI